MELQVGQIVVFSNPQDESEGELLMRVIEPRGDRTLVETILPEMNLQPQNVYPTSDLTLALREVSDLVGYVDRIKAATTREEIGKIYVDMVGYDSAAESPEMGVEELRADAFDYVREVCYQTGVHCRSVGLLNNEAV